MFYSSPDEDIPFFRPLEPRLFSPSPEETSSYLESQTQEFSKPTSTALQSPQTTPTTSSYISFLPFNQPTMFSRLRKIIMWPCSTGTPISSPTSTNIKTIYPNSKGTYTITKTSLPSPPPSISCGEEDQTIMSSTCTSLRRSSRPRLTISIPESNITGRTLAVQNQQVNICSHTRKVHWSDPLIVAVSANPPTRVATPPTSSHLKWGNPLITKVSVEPPHPHLRHAMGVARLSWSSPLITKVSAEPLHPHLRPTTTMGSEGDLPSMVAARYCSHEETVGLVKAISGFVLRGGERGDGEIGGPVEATFKNNDGISPLELDTGNLATAAKIKMELETKVSKHNESANIEETVEATTNDTSSSFQNINIFIIETSNEIQANDIGDKIKGEVKPTTMNHSTHWTSTPWTDEEFERYKQEEYGWII